MAGTKRHVGLQRVLRLAQQLQGARYVPSLIDLARETGVSTRTVRRDLELLEAVGWPLPHWRQGRCDGVEQDHGGEHGRV
jgi:predicted DNA-binding transcriptional regulator YafY